MLLSNLNAEKWYINYSAQTMLLNVSIFVNTIPKYYELLYNIFTQG